MDGWVKLHRKLMEWEWYSDANTFRLFVHLLLRASYEANEWRGVTLKSGQVLTGRKQLAKELVLSERQIRTALKNLQTTNEVTIKSTNKYSIISITNWSKYQPKDKPATSKTPAYGPANDHTQEVEELFPKGIPTNRPPSPDKVLFDFGRVVLGEKAGGVITELKKQKGTDGAYKLLEEAEKKSNPMQWINACIRKKQKPSYTPAPNYGG